MRKKVKKSVLHVPVAISLRFIAVASSTLRIARVALRRFKGIDDAAFRPQEGVASFPPRSGKTIPAAEQRVPRFPG